MAGQRPRTGDAVAVKPPSVGLLGWRRWWHCHRQFRMMRVKLERAGVMPHDPAYPLIIELGMVPARLARMLVVLVLAVVLAAMASAAAYQAFVGVFSPVRTMTMPDGGRMLVIDAPDGARWHKCASAAQVCLELLPTKRLMPAKE